MFFLIHSASRDISTSPVALHVIAPALAASPRSVEILENVHVWRALLDRSVWNATRDTIHIHFVYVRRKHINILIKLLCFRAPILFFTLQPVIAYSLIGVIQKVNVFPRWHNQQSVRRKHMWYFVQFENSLMMLRKISEKRVYNSYQNIYGY